jgi:hypothetical protein
MIKISVRGIEELHKYFASLQAELRKMVIPTVTEYLLGDENHGLRHYVPYKYVSRKLAYGQTFVSAKQRRYVMAAIRDGRITPGRSNRTGATAAGWSYKVQGGGYGASITNSTPGARYTMGDDTQARQPAKVGWRKAMAVISTNIDGAIRKANQVIEAWIKRNS